MVTLVFSAVIVGFMSFGLIKYLEYREEKQLETEAKTINAN